MSEFPTDAEIELHLQELGLLTGSLPTALAGISEVAVAQWLRDTGYSVWLPTEQTHEYEIRQGLIVPSSGIIELVSLTVDGSVLDPYQFRLHPVNRVGLGIPAQWIELKNTYVGDATIEAVYGWSDAPGQEVPADAWQAVLLLACYLASSNLAESTATAGSLSSVQQGDVRYSFASENALSRQQGWRQTYSWTVRRYTRAGVV